MSPDNTNPVQIKCWITSSIYCLEQFLFIYLFFFGFLGAGFCHENEDRSGDLQMNVLNLVLM